MYSSATVHDKKPSGDDSRVLAVIAEPIHHRPRRTWQTLAAPNFACLSPRFEKKRDMQLHELLKVRTELTHLLAAS